MICLIFSIGVALAESLEMLVDPFGNSAPIQVTPDKKLNIRFNEAPLAEILQILAKQTHKNIIFTEEVKGTLTLMLDHVTAEQALAAVLRLKNLSMSQHDNVIYITLKNQPQDNLLQNNLQTQIIKIHYAKAADIAAILRNPQNSFLSKQGLISVDPRTNSLWVEDQPDTMRQILLLIKRIDAPLQQVLIKARIVSINQDCLQELGVKFGTTVLPQHDLTLGGLQMDLPLTINQMGHFNLAIATLAANALLDLELTALESEGRGKVLSSPELTTTDGMPAYIEAGEEVPYQEKTSSGATNIAFKKAVLSLKVTPQVINSNKLALTLTVNQDKLSALSVHGVPVIQTREIETQVMLDSGQTIVLGGIYEQTDRNNESRIPFLSALPGVGFLFRHLTNQTDQRELLVFVTPQIKQINN